MSFQQLLLTSQRQTLVTRQQSIKGFSYVRYCGVILCLCLSEEALCVGTAACLQYVNVSELYAATVALLPCL